jgi:hypothetical protein
MHLVCMCVYECMVVVYSVMQDRSEHRAGWMSDATYAKHLGLKGCGLSKHASAFAVRTE